MLRGRFCVTKLQTTAKNHDPQHVPYGIQWISSLASGYATEQFPISSFGSPRHRAELHTTAEELQQAAEPQTAQKTTSSTEELTKPASGSATEQTQPEEKRQPLPAEELQQAALADDADEQFITIERSLHRTVSYFEQFPFPFSMEEDEARMRAASSAREQTLPEERRQPLPADKMLAYSTTTSSRQDACLFHCQ